MMIEGLIAWLAISATLPTHTRTGVVAQTHHARTSFGATQAEGWIYLYGGYDGVPHRYSREGQSGEFVRYPIDQWDRMEVLSPSTALQGAALVDIPGAILRIGGMQARNGASEAQDLWSSAEVACFELTTQEWQSWPPLPAPRSSHDVERVGRQVVVMGGWQLTGTRKGTFHSCTLVLDLDRREAGWREIQAPFQRRALSVAALGNQVVAIGGIDANGVLDARVDALDLSTEQWSRLPAFPGEGFGVAATTHEGALYASGSDGKLWRLAVGASAWEALGTWTFPRFFHHLVASPSGSIIALGGIDQMRSTGGRIRHIEQTQSGGSNTPHLARFETTVPLVSKNRQGLWLQGNELFLWGGNRSLAQHDFGAEDFRVEGASLDLSSLTWTERAEFPAPRQSMSLVGEEQAWALGGFGYTPKGGTTQASSFRYDPKLELWHPTPLQDLPVPLTQFGWVEHAGRAWLFGGMDYQAEREDAAFRIESRVWSYEFAAQRWEQADFDLGSPRRAFACTGMAGQVYIVGGMAENFAAVAECIQIDLGTGRRSPMPQPKRVRVSAELLALSGKLWLIGGSSRDANGKLQPDRSIECFDPASQKWSVVIEDIPDLLPHARAMVLRDRILIVSTHSQDAALLKGWVLSP